MRTTSLSYSRKLFTWQPRAVEHSSVLDAAKELEKQGFDVVYLQPDEHGKIPRESIFSAITKDTVLVSLQMVNNELGAIQPVEALAAAIKRTAICIVGIA